MTTSRIGRWAALGAALLWGCDDGGRPPLSVGSVAGQVAWAGAAGQAIELAALTADGATGPTAAQGVVEPTGAFRLPGLRLDDGDYALRVALRGRSLATPVLDYVRYSDRSVTVSPLTSLAVSAARGRAGGPERFAAALADLRRHLGLDPVTTAVGVVGSDLADEATRHALLLDAFDAVAARRAPAGSVSAPALLDALLSDASTGTLDGLGPDGPVPLGAGLLGDQALQGELADAVLALVTDGPWAVVGEAAARDLIARLRCSGSPLFPGCEPVDPDQDVTPPVIQGVDPPEGTALSGLATITVQAADPDGELTRIELTRLEGNTPVEAYPALEGRPNVFQIDTRLLRGQDTLAVRVTAHNAVGMTSQRDLSYPLMNVGRGVLAGWITKGPARRALVRAYGFDGLAQVPLGEARTDDAGRFELTIAEYSGPVLVEATSDPAAQPRTVFDDEVRGETGWPADRTLSTLHPTFDALAENPPLSVTPFGDLAASLARRQAAANEASLVEAHRQAAEAVGAWLGLDAPLTSLVHGRPAPFDTPAAGFEDPERVGMALGCFSEQAATLTARYFPDGANAVNALDLVALYRLDVESDGRADGLAGAAPATIVVGATAVALPSDALRADLPGACARWAQHERNEMALEPQALVAWRGALAAHEDARLFDPTLPPRPADDAPPMVVASWAPVDGGITSDNSLSVPADTPTARLPAVRGQVRFELRLNDASGPAQASVSLRGQPAAEFAAVQMAHSVGVDFVVGWAGTLDTDQLPEGEHALLVDAADPLGNGAQTAFRFQVDRTAPSVEPLVPFTVSADGQEWHTQGREVSALQVQIEEQGSGTAEVRAAGEVLAQVSYDGPSMIEVPIPAQPQEGRFAVSLRVTSNLDEPVVVNRTLVVDRTPPALSVLPTRYRDEATLDHRRLLDDAPELVLSGEGGTIRHWQTHWQEESDNPAELAWAASDAAGESAGTAPAQILVELTHCLGSPDRCEHGQGMAQFSGNESPVTFSAGQGGLLDFAPENPPAPADLALSIRAQDLAGNGTEVELPLRVEVLPPPVAVDFAPPTPSFADDSIERLLLGEEVELTTVQFNNPHAVDTEVTLQLRDDARVELRAALRPSNYRAVDNVVGLAECQEAKPGDLSGQLGLVEDCLQLHAGAPFDCSQVEACLPFSAAYNGWSSPILLTFEGGRRAATLNLPPNSMGSVAVFTSIAEPLENNVYSAAADYREVIGDAITQVRSEGPLGDEQLITIRANFEQQLSGLTLDSTGLEAALQTLAGEEYMLSLPGELLQISR